MELSLFSNIVLFYINILLFKYFSNYIIRFYLLSYKDILESKLPSIDIIFLFAFIEFKT